MSITKEKMKNIKIQDSVLENIKNQLAESEKFEVEICEKEYCLVVSGDAEVTNFYEEETNYSETLFTKIELSVNAFDENGNKLDITDEFEKNIFDQINFFLS